ncbi:hypothetical protein [Alkalicoccus chagannorensis]|uniref:hypothetical protein n=1 Tax=Alkalicoccus chagannorensis TaxID=427072 RepID=UPI0003F7AA7B|nr:hypothetical protein [Alkalicoccus chagannorensis]
MRASPAAGKLPLSWARKTTENIPRRPAVPHNQLWRPYSLDHSMMTKKKQAGSSLIAVFTEKITAMRRMRYID